MHGTLPPWTTLPAICRVSDPLFRGSALPHARARTRTGRNVRRQRCAQRACRADSGSDPFGDTGTLPLMKPSRGIASMSFWSNDLSLSAHRLVVCQGDDSNPGMST